MQSPITLAMDQTPIGDAATHILSAAILAEWVVVGEISPLRTKLLNERYRLVSPAKK